MTSKNTEVQQYNESIQPDEQAKQEATVGSSAIPFLEDCAPTKYLPTATAHKSNLGIWRPGQDAVFTTLDDPATFECVIERLYDAWNNYTGEMYYPVPKQFQGNIGVPSRPVAFHPCVTAAGATFIYPQKLDPPRSRVNSWNASLADAFAYPPGQWRRIWSDSDSQRYQHDLVSPPMEGLPEYPEFREDLEKALSPNIITALDHPVVQRLLGKQDPEVGMEEIY